MARVYLETSFISACVSDRSDIGSVYRREVSLAWWNHEGPRHRLFASDEVVTELSDRRFARSDAAMALIADVPIIGVTADMVALAEALVRAKAMPRPVAGDALHVAMATVPEMEYMLTWNVRHLANPNNVEHVTGVCREFGLVPPRILRPDDMMEMNDE